MKIYHAGDTDFIEEMRELKSKDIDYALLPMGGKYTMDLDEGIEAAKAINAKRTVPMHYKNLLGENGAAELEEKLKKAIESALILKEIQIVGEYQGS